LTTALSGLQTSAAMIQVSSENISNAGKAGYTQKTALLSTSQTGNASITSVSGYSRATDDATKKALLASTTEDGSLSTTNSYLQQVESLLGSTNSSTSDSIADYMSTFATAWSTLDSEPESETAQAAVVTAGENLTNAIRTASNGTETLYRGIQSDISTTVSTINSSLSQIANYNKLIAQASATGGSTVDLQDARDVLIQNLSSVMSVTSSSQGNGTISLFTSGGFELVTATSSKTFAYDSASQMVYCPDSPSTSMNGTLTGGSLQAALNFIDSSPAATASTQNGVGTIQKLRDSLDSIVTSLTSPTSSFQTAYNTNDNDPAATDPANNFFYISGATNLDSSNITVNSKLTNGAQTLASMIKGNLTTDETTADIFKKVADTFNDTSQTFQVGTLDTATGTVSNVWKTVSNASYETLSSTLIAYFQNSAATVSSLASTASSQKSTLATNYANATGVDTDTELVKLTTLENAYNASAKVISIVNSMFTTLHDMF
jgi:flagellar hook-associated protein 1 FlgK